jgi:transmembrane sensor
MKPLPLAACIVPRWGNERRERLLLAVHSRVSRARRLRALAAVAIAALALVGAGVAWRTRAQSTSAVAAVSGQEVRFSDGSSVRLLDTEASLDIGRASPNAVEVTLRAGSADFAITPNPARLFVVHAGVADVSVLGTRFRVTRNAERVRVEVTHGRVSVAYVGGSRLLTDGESNWFPPAEVGEPAPAASLSAVPPAGTVPVLTPLPKATPEPHAERRRFLEQASRREYAEAFEAIQRTPDVVGTDASDLLRAADVARFSGHPRDATGYLERVVREHAQESVAPLAAFTLGRIELSQLRQPAKAADDFARAIALAPDGSLAEDALARETEAAELAGQHDRARRLAEQYLQRFPQGRRADSVRRSGGLIEGKPSSQSR